MAERLINKGKSKEIIVLDNKRYSLVRFLSVKKPLNTGNVGCSKKDLHQIYTIYNKKSLDMMK